MAVHPEVAEAFLLQVNLGGGRPDAHRAVQAALPVAVGALPPLVDLEAAKAEAGLEAGETWPRCQAVSRRRCRP